MLSIAIFEKIKNSRYAKYTVIYLKNGMLNARVSMPLSYRNLMHSLLGLLLFPLLCSASQTQFPYILRIHFPTHIKKIPSIYGYYKGQQLTFENDMTLFFDPQQRTHFTLVITPEVAHQATDNHIKYLRRKPDVECSVYSLDREYDPEAGTTKGWKIQQEDLKSLPERLPDDALILLLDPSLITSISYSKAHDTKTGIINLPSIFIKTALSQEELDSAALHGILASLDINAFHKRIETATKEAGSVIISMRSN